MPGRPVRPKIAFIGRQERWKGPDLFVDLVSDLPAECHEGALLVGPSVRLGEVDSRTELTRLAERRGIALGHVQFTRSDLWKQMACSDWIALLPSRKDTFNLVALEALLCGVPTAVSARAGVCGFLEQVLPVCPSSSSIPTICPRPDRHCWTWLTTTPPGGTLRGYCRRQNCVHWVIA